MPITALCLNGIDFNAFAAPGGIIGVNRGIYLDLDSESKVMAILVMNSPTFRNVITIEAQEFRTDLTGTLATFAGIVAAIATGQERQIL